ncbi:YdeI/OmpD-associated family protein [Paenibacillus sp. sgz500958]|uniref:YdeI/OmpD-associated family protein n=1 Tax=Paenibacillus sp. sgz500958 TaxID=3242475 RepID=UPI0036D3103C
MKFRAEVQLAGKTATGIQVPDDIVEGLGAGKKPAVKVTIGGHSYRSTIATMGGKYMLPLSAENRNAAGVSAGEEVEVEVELDSAPRELEIPADFAAALQGEAAAQAFFEGLSYSNKRRIVLSIEGAKTEETRQRRISKSVDMLKENRIQ